MNTIVIMFVCHGYHPFGNYRINEGGYHDTYLGFSGGIMVHPSFWILTAWRCGDLDELGLLWLTTPHLETAWFTIINIMVNVVVYTGLPPSFPWGTAVFARERGEWGRGIYRECMCVWMYTHTLPAVYIPVYICIIFCLSHWLHALVTWCLPCVHEPNILSTEQRGAECLQLHVLAVHLLTRPHLASWSSWLLRLAAQSCAKSLST